MHSEQPKSLTIKSESVSEHIWEKGRDGQLKARSSARLHWSIRGSYDTAAPLNQPPFPATTLMDSSLSWAAYILN